MDEATRDTANLAGANLWRRPDPGRPKVFLSFHGVDQPKAEEVKEALLAANIVVVAYDPFNRWPDGPMEMLRRLVTECHCMVYVGRSAINSRYVRFELCIAREFGIKIVRLRSAKKVDRGLKLVVEEATKTHVPDILWGLTVSKAITRACDELNSTDIAASEVNRTGMNGLDLFDRHFGRKLSEDLAPIIAFTPRQKAIIVALFAAALFSLASAALLYFRL